MKRCKLILALLAAALLVLPGCGQKVPAGQKAPAYENLLVTENTVESDRFGLRFEAGEGFSVLLDELLSFAGEVESEAFLTGEEYTRGDKTYRLHSLAMVTSFEDSTYITFQSLPAEVETVEEFFTAYRDNLADAGTVSEEMTPVTVCGQEGGCFTVEQTYIDRATGYAYTFYNQLYVVISDGWMLTVNCSGNQFPQGCIDALAAQKIIQ